MAVAVVGGLITFFVAGFGVRPYVEWGMTIDVRARLEIIEKQIDGLIVSVDTIKDSVANKEYETDKDLVLAVIEAYQKKMELARNP